MRHRGVGLLAMLHAAMILGGCNDIEDALIVRGGIIPEMSMGACVYDGGGKPTLAYWFDAAAQATLTMGLSVENNLQGGVVPFAGSAMVPDDFLIPNRVTPVRMDLRWECDSNGFSDDVGSLYLPQFSVENPFCLDEDTREFAGFDVIPASGGSIKPSEVGVAFVRPVTAQLGQAFADVFEMARLADDCCQAAGTSCDDSDLQAVASTPACSQLQNVFNAVAGNDRLSAQSFADIQKFRPFTAYDASRNTPKPGQGIGPAFPMRLRGVLEGVTGDGTTVSSTEFSIDVGLCSGCLPAVGPSCNAY